MNNVFETNIYLLKKNYPSLAKRLQSIKPTGEIRFEDSPRPNLIYREVSIYPSEGPDEYILKQLQGLKVEEGIIYLFLGIGLAYQIESFFKLYGEQCQKTKIILIEKNPEIFFHLINYKDISFLIRPSITLLVGEDLNRITDIFESISPIYFRGYRIIKHPVIYELDVEYFRDVENNFKLILGSGLTDLFTRHFFEPLWFKNIISNIPVLATAIPLRAFKKRFSGVPAVIAGAGPSLKKDIESLKHISERFCIISTDTAIRTLVCSGIIPNFVISLDAQYHSIMDFQNLPQYLNSKRDIPYKDKKPFLLADLTCYPGVLKLGFEDICLIKSLNISHTDSDGAHEVSSLYGFVARYTDRIDGLVCGGSVVTTGIEFALYAGFFPVVLCGTDFSYPGYLTHVVSSPYHREAIVKSKRTSTTLNFTVNSIIKRRLVIMRDRLNRPTFSDVVLKKYMEWLEKRNAHYAGRVFFSSNNSISLPGFEEIELQQLEGKKFKAIQEIEAIRGKENDSIYKTPLKILNGLKEELIMAKEWLEINNLNEETLGDYLNKFTFLYTVVLVFSKFYKNPVIIKAQLESFLSMCINTAEKAIKTAIS